jgi:hypothetical protein
MRLLKLKTPVLALILSIAAVALLRALSMVVGFAYYPATSINLLDRSLELFYFPAELLAFLCLPSSAFIKGVPPLVLMEVVSAFFALVQWYVILLVSIGLYRHFHKRHRDDIQAT